MQSRPHQLVPVGSGEAEVLVFFDTQVLEYTRQHFFSARTSLQEERERELIAKYNYQETRPFRLIPPGRASVCRRPATGFETS